MSKIKTSAKYPAHAYPDAHSFRSEKRRNLRELEKAAKKMREGCAYFGQAGYEATNAIMDRIELLKTKLSVKEWGR